MNKILPAYQNVRTYEHDGPGSFDKLVRHVAIRILIFKLPVQFAQHTVLPRSVLVIIHVCFFASHTLR